MKPEISVIIPVYNGEKSVSKAIESVISQTITNIEIIIVNDGSTDNTAEIIDKYASSDIRIKVIDKKTNEGLSPARNSGMKEVTSDYFTFLDADDYFEPDAFEKMLAASRGADITVTGFFHDTLDDNGELSVSVENRSGKNLFADSKKDIIGNMAMLDEKRLFAFTWNKLYKKSFIDAAGILFSDQQLIEDYEFNCYVFEKLETLSILDDCIYHYVKFSQDALTQKYRPEYFEIMDKRYTLMKNIFERNGIFDGEYREILCTMHIKHIVAGIVKNCSDKSPLSKKEQKAVIRGLFNDENCCEAVRFAKGKRKQEKVCNTVFATRSVLLNYMLARILWSMQNSKSNIFDRLK